MGMLCCFELTRTLKRGIVLLRRHSLSSNYIVLRFPTLDIVLNSVEIRPIYTQVHPHLDLTVMSDRR